jgi:hypothetical protein
MHKEVIIVQTRPKPVVGHQKGPRGRSGPEAERFAFRIVRGGGADGPRVRRVS